MMNKITKYLLFTVSLFGSLCAFEDNGAAAAVVSKSVVVPNGETVATYAGLFTYINDNPLDILAAAAASDAAASSLSHSSSAVAVQSSEPVKIDGTTTYKCPFCPKFDEGKNRSFLIMHIRTHTGEKPFKCETCGQLFSTNGHLTEHTRIHTGEKPYQCDSCEQCFKKRETLTKHIITHTGKSPFKCDFCEKCFAKKSNFTTHKRTHTGEKPFQCTICEKCFAVNKALKRHEKIHAEK